MQALADGQAASLDQLQDNLQGPTAAAAQRNGSATAGLSGLDRPRAPGGGGRARRKSGIIMSELGANLKPLPPSAATVSSSVQCKCLSEVSCLNMLLLDLLSVQ